MCDDIICPVGGVLDKLTGQIPTLPDPTLGGDGDGAYR